MEWEGLVPSHVFKHTLLCVLNILANHQVQGCLFDLIKMKGISPKDQDWLVEEILPAMSEAKLRKVAFLETSFNRTGHLNLTELVYSKFPVILFEFQYFEDVASAMDWLGNMPVRQDLFVPSSQQLSIAQ